MRLDPETERRILATPGVVISPSIPPPESCAPGAGGPPHSVPHRGRGVKHPVRLLAPQLGVTVTLPLVVVSEPNRREHWTRRNHRAGAARAAWLVTCHHHGLRRDQFCLPVAVTLVRAGGPGRLDDDNLAAAFKHLRDAIAGWFGVDDGGSLLTWQCGQVPWPNRRGVLVSLLEVGEP